jgi:hypothetical protein
VPIAADSATLLLAAVLLGLATVAALLGFSLPSGATNG